MVVEQRQGDDRQDHQGHALGRHARRINKVLSSRTRERRRQGDHHRASRALGWTLVDTPKPLETTPAVYRFEASAAHKLATLAVKEESVRSESLAMLPMDVSVLLVYQRNGSIPAKVRDAIAKAIALKNAVTDLDRQIAARTQDINGIASASPGWPARPRRWRPVAGSRCFGPSANPTLRDIPFHVVARLLRAGSGITDLDGDAARARVRERLPDADAQDLLLLDDLLGIADPDVPLPQIDPDARRRRLTALINTASLARTEPALYIIEDAHWIDAVSESMLADLLTVIPQHQVDGADHLPPRIRGSADAGARRPNDSPCPPG